MARARAPKTPPWTPGPAGPQALAAALSQIKAGYDEAAAQGGTALTSLTRSAKPIKILHSYIGNILVAAGVDKSKVGFEKGIETLFGSKRQDVVVVPRGAQQSTGASTISIGLKGQLYGIQKNLDNSFSSVRSELLSFHEVHTNMVVAHVHLVALMEWDSAASKARHEVAYKRLSTTTLNEMIDRYAKINARGVGDSEGFAERIALVLVDFSQPVPVVYTEVSDLERGGFLPRNSGLSLDGLTLDRFGEDLLTTHRERFTGAHRL